MTVRLRPGRKAALAALLLLALSGATLALESRSTEATTDDKLYWIEMSAGPERIMRSDLDGTNIEELVVEEMAVDSGFQFPDMSIAQFEQPPSLALDIPHGYIYWTNPELNQVKRAQLDGSNIEVLAQYAFERPSAIAVDPFAERLYWAYTTKTSSTLERSDLDGTNREEILTNSAIIMALAIDVARGLLYWGNEEGSIFSSTATGNGPAIILHGTPVEGLKAGIFVLDIEVVANGPSDNADLYWNTASPPVESCVGFPGPLVCITSDATSTVTRSLQGAAPESLLNEELDDAGAIAIDPKTETLYRAYLSGLGSSNLDATTPALLVADITLADVEIGLTELPFVVPDPVGGIVRSTGLASLPVAEERGASATPWVAAVLIGIGAALGGAWFARRESAAR